MQHCTERKKIFPQTFTVGLSVSAAYRLKRTTYKQQLAGTR